MPDKPDFWARVGKATRRGLERGWDTEDPIGLDPETYARMQRNGTFSRTPLGAVNQATIPPAAFVADLLGRSGNALAHAIATGGGQLVNEAAGTDDRRAERDIMMGMQMIGARAGRPGTGAAVSGLGRSSADAAKKGAGAVHREYYTRRLAKELGKADPQTTGFGRIAPRLLSELNAIRRIEGEPPIGTRDVNVYAAVLRKFQDKRLGLDGLTPRQVAETIYRVVHGPNTQAGRGAYPTSHRLENMDGDGAAVGFVGRGPEDDVSVKSIRQMPKKKFEKSRKR